MSKYSLMVSAQFEEKPQDLSREIFVSGGGVEMQEQRIMVGFLLLEV